MPVYTLNVAAERSIVDALTDIINDSSVAFYTGLNNEDKAAPCVIVESARASETYYGTNIYRMSVKVTVAEMAADIDKDSIGQLASKVFNCFFDPNRATNFSNTDYGYTVFQVQPLDMENETSEDAIINRFTLDFVCCLSGTATN